MSNIGDAFKNIFLAGIGAMAYTGEKGKEIIDQLARRAKSRSIKVRSSTRS